MRTHALGKVGSLFLAAIIAGTSLAGCKSTTGSSKSGSGTAQSGSSQLVSQQTTLTVLMPEHPSYPVKAYDQSPFLQNITKLTNVKLDLTIVPDSGDSYKQKLNIMLNGGNLPDVIWSSSDDNNINSLAVRGMFAAYTDYLNIAPHLKKVLSDNPDIQKSMSATNKKLYIMPRLTLDTMTEIFMMREDVMQKEKLSQPSSYDDLYTMLKQLKQDYPNNKIFINRNGTEHLVNRLGYSWGTGYEPTTFGFYLNRSTGKYTYGPFDPTFKDMVSWLKKLYDDKILDADYALMDTKKWEETYANENALFSIDYIARVQTLNNNYINKGSQARVVAINPPKGSTGKQGIIGRSRVMSNSGIVINAKSQNIQTAVKFVDWIYSDAGRYVATYGIEGETYTVGSDGKPTLTDKMQRQANPNGKQLVKDYGWVYYLNKFEFPVGFLQNPASDPKPADDRYMFSRSVMESKNLVITPDPALHYTDSQSAALKASGTDISDYFKQNIDKFIMGTRPMSEWSNFLNELKKLGTADVEKTLDDAYAAYKKQ